MIGPSQFELWLCELATDSRGDFHPDWWAGYCQMDLYEIRVAEAVMTASKDNLRSGGEYLAPKPKGKEDSEERAGRSGNAALLLAQIRARRKGPTASSSAPDSPPAQPDEKSPRS